MRQFRFQLQLHGAPTLKSYHFTPYISVSHLSSFSLTSPGIRTLLIHPLSKFHSLRNAHFNDVRRLHGRSVAVQPITLCKMNDSDLMSQLELGKPLKSRIPEKRVNGIFWIILLNLGIYVADHIFQVRGIQALYLYHNQPVWYQFLTATFCHANWNHLSSNLFFLYIFGKLVEEEEGNFALWISYILTGVGANMVSWLILPRNAVSVGASGAVFGLFTISVLVKMSWDWRKILEVLILGQFVIEKVMEAAQASTALSGSLRGGYALQNVNHVAHLSGALVGVFLVWLLSRVPSETPEQEASNSGGKGR